MKAWSPMSRQPRRTGNPTQHPLPLALEALHFLTIGRVSLLHLSWWSPTFHHLLQCLDERDSAPPLPPLSLSTATTSRLFYATTPRDVIISAVSLLLLLLLFFPFCRSSHVDIHTAFSRLPATRHKPHIPAQPSFLVAHF